MTPEETKEIIDALDAKLATAATKNEIESVKSDFAKQLADVEKGVTVDELEAMKTDFNTKLVKQWEEVQKLTQKAEKPAVKKSLNLIPVKTMVFELASFRSSISAASELFKITVSTARFNLRA